MKLFHRDFGGEGKPPLIVLHGLLGSSRNWTAVGRDLNDMFHVVGLDLRNHGSSPHTAQHSYELMAADVVAWLDEAGLDKVHLLGHSMGGKTAMRVACEHAHRVESLAVVDIAPRAKEPKHAPEVRALSALPVEELSSRAEADRLLAQNISSVTMRQFLLTNLVRRKEGGWGWQANVHGLSKNLAETGRAPIGEQDRFEGPSLWIVGGKSDFVQSDDHALIREHFPRTRIELFSESGHNPHAEERERFVEVVREFLCEASP